MRTYRGNATVQFKIVAQQQFVDDLRRIARGKEAPADVFLAQMDARHPINDDAFVEAVLKNGIRKILRGALLSSFVETPGRTVGGTVAPPVVEIISVVPEHETNAKPLLLEHKPVKEEA